jgi:hypothetical protein
MILRHEFMREFLKVITGSSGMKIIFGPDRERESGRGYGRVSKFNIFIDVALQLLLCLLVS